MGRIPEHVIEQVAAATDIVELIGGYFPLRRAGATYKALCPFHQERSPSFTVNPQRQIFKCFGCGAGGGVFKFVELYENLSYPDAIKRLAEKAGIQIVEEQLTESGDKRLKMRKRLLSLHAGAAAWFHRNLMKTGAATHARDYLKTRGIGGDVARKWQLGFAPESWDDFSNWAHDEGFSTEEILRSGMVTLRTDREVNLTDLEQSLSGLQFYDRWRDRLMFPICNKLGEVIAFSGRVLSAEAKGGKYVNSPETMLFKKGDVLFGLHKAMRPLIDKGSAIVCEGQLDLITAFEAGVQNVIAPQGTAFTREQAHILQRYVQEVVLCFDADAAGQKAAEKSLPALMESGLTVRIASMPAGHDPDSLIRAEGPAAFEEQIENARDFFDFQIDVETAKPEFASPQGQRTFARKMAEFIGLIPDQILREAVIHKVTARIGIAPAEFRRLIKKPSQGNAARTEKGAASTPEVISLSPAMARLCQLALQNAATRQWLSAQNPGALLAQLPDGALLEKILADTSLSSDSGVLNRFLAELPDDEQALLSGLLTTAPVPDAERDAQACWLGLERDLCKKRLESIEARLRAPGLALESVMQLQREHAILKKEFLDHQKRLADIARPFP